ncbi:MAG: glutamine-synthetase adenylyltransferase [Paracoccaceae bacterium]
MKFELKPKRVPKVFDQRIAQEIYNLFSESSEKLRTFFASVASCSPYLYSQIVKEKSWLVNAVGDNDFNILSLLSSLDSETYDSLYLKLRIAKRRAALWIALNDLADTWSLEVVTKNLSEFADKAINLSWQASFLKELKKGKFPKQYDGDPDKVGFFILAMGKLGAFELNYSSDIDLICFFDEELFHPKEFQDVRRIFINATKNMYRILSENGTDGYVFRTDLRLRPDPSVTPVCMGVDAAERYYASLGRTWERAAFIKARVCAGDHSAGIKFLKNMEPFIWRKYLDYAAISDAHDIRLRIRDHYKTKKGDITLPKHNMKLGRGGIRDIEFFTQTHQIIFGGRDKSIRSRATITSLRAVADKKWLPKVLVKDLIENYRFHRTIEHRLQMVNDAQTHELPNSDQGFARLACLMGAEKDDLQKELIDRLSKTNSAIEGFFEPENTDQNIQNPSLSEEFKDQLKKWESFPALRTTRAISIFERIKPVMLEKINSTARPKETLKAFGNFLSKLPAGIQIFSLFENNKQILDLLIDILGTSGALSEYLVKNTDVLDSVIASEFWKIWPGREFLSSELEVMLESEMDYEAKLDLTRRWCKEWQFRIGVHYLRSQISAISAGSQYAELAEITLNIIWKEVLSEFAKKFGPEPGNGGVVISMGSLGSGVLHANSDLDLIIIYDADGNEQSEGDRSLSARQYYSRLTKAFITAISAPMSEGRLYEIDMRLRPSGFQGPVATSWSSYQNYQKNEAWVWEHLALTRARAVAGKGFLLNEFETFRSSLLKSYNRKNIFSELVNMRRRIFQAKTSNPWDAKIGPGRLQDIDLLSQAGCLANQSVSRSTVAGLEALIADNFISQKEFSEIKAAATQLWSWQIGLNILFKGQVELENLDVLDNEAQVEIFEKQTPTEVKNSLHHLSNKINKVINKILSDKKG